MMLAVNKFISETQTPLSTHEHPLECVLMLLTVVSAEPH